MAAGILTGILLSAGILGRIPTSPKALQVTRALTSEEIETPNGVPISAVAVKTDDTKEVLLATGVEDVEG